MLHLFVSRDKIDADGKKLTVTGDDYHHIAHVLRMKAGEELSVSVEDGDEEYRYGIEEITKDSVICTLRFVKKNTAELSVRIVLLQALPKSDKMEQIIEKCVELGVDTIIPVRTKRCVMKLDEKKESSRIARWNQIALSAAKQARRGKVPEVTRVMSLAEALRETYDADVKLLPYELAPDTGEGMDKTRRLIASVSEGQAVSVLIGPEGGFEEQEVKEAEGSGYQAITLGSRILRTETAGMTVVAWLMLQTQV